MMPIEYEKVTYETLGDEFLAFKIKPTPIIKGNPQVLTNFLDDFRSGLYDLCMREVDSVLNGSSDTGYLCGEGYSADLTKEETIISYNYNGGEEETCKLPTKEFREIFEVWLRESNEFYEEQYKKRLSEDQKKQ